MLLDERHCSRGWDKLHPSSPVLCKHPWKVPAVGAMQVMEEHGAGHGKSLEEPLGSQGA